MKLAKNIIVASTLSVGAVTGATAAASQDGAPCGAMVMSDQQLDDVAAGVAKNRRVNIEEVGTTKAAAKKPAAKKAAPRPIKD